MTVSQLPNVPPSSLQSTDTTPDAGAEPVPTGSSAVNVIVVEVADELAAGLVPKATVGTVVSTTNVVADEVVLLPAVSVCTATAV